MNTKIQSIPSLKKFLTPLFLLAGLWLTQTALSQADPIPDHPRVNQVNGRVQNQQARVAQGVANGNLTVSQTAHIENNEAALKQEEQGMRSGDNGHLTTQDQAALNQQQNKLSNQIYNAKH